MTDLSDAVNSLNSRLNDLNLENSILIDIPKDIIYPNELNKFLKEKVEYLTYENGMLRKNVTEYEDTIRTKKCEMKALTSKIETYESTNDLTSIPNAARTKIVELSRKLREKVSELEVWKTRFSKIEQELATAKFHSNTENIEIVKPVKDKKFLNDMDPQIKLAQDRYNVVNSKLFDEKNTNLMLKNELKLAKKLLQEEIGESFESVQQLSTSSNWRGRSQLISDMQHKNNELREKLKALQEKDGVKIIDQKKLIWERKLEKSNKDIECLKTENTDLKKRSDALKARCKNIEIECSMWKTKCNSFAEQSDRDRELISTITNQNMASVTNQNDILKKKEQAIEKLLRDMRTIKQDLKREACKVENLEIIIEEKDCELEKAKQRTFVTQYDSGKAEDRATQRLEAEQIRFTELILVSNQRLTSERDARCNAEYLHRQERQRAAKLEAKLTRLQLGESTERGSTYRSILSKCSVPDSSMEYKLELAEENIKALQTRLAIEKREKELDLQEFTKFVKNCKCSRE